MDGYGLWGWIEFLLTVCLVWFCFPIRKEKRVNQDKIQFYIARVISNLYSSEAKRYWGLE